MTKSICNNDIATVATKCPMEDGSKPGYQSHIPHNWKLLDYFDCDYMLDAYMYCKMQHPSSYLMQKENTNYHWSEYNKVWTVKQIWVEHYLKHIGMLNTWLLKLWNTYTDSKKKICITRKYPLPRTEIRISGQRDVSVEILF